MVIELCVAWIIKTTITGENHTLKTVLACSTPPLLIHCRKQHRNIKPETSQQTRNDLNTRRSRCLDLAHSTAYSSARARSVRPWCWGERENSSCFPKLSPSHTAQAFCRLINSPLSSCDSGFMHSKHTNSKQLHKLTIQVAGLLLFPMLPQLCIPRMTNAITQGTSFLTYI